MLLFFLKKKNGKKIQKKNSYCISKSEANQKSWITNQTIWTQVTTPQSHPKLTTTVGFTHITIIKQYPAIGITHTTFTDTWSPHPNFLSPNTKLLYLNLNNSPITNHIRQYDDFLFPLKLLTSDYLTMRKLHSSPPTIIYFSLRPPIH